jgi:hypothetical protein
METMNRSDGSATSCSAWVINEHWLLTAGHCVERSTNGEVVDVGRADRIASVEPSLSSPAAYFIHPGAVKGTTPHDVALIHLLNQGFHADRTGVAKMYSDTRRPWADASLPRGISAAGWGFATPDPNDPTGCTGGGGALRRTDTMTVDVSSTTTSIVTSPIGAQFPCTGDSGAPWLLQRGDASGSDFLGFAVHSRRDGSPKKGQAAPLDDNRAWIESTIVSVAATERYGAYCYDSDVAGFRYRRCDQISRGWGQLRALGKCLQANSATPGSAVSMVACNQSLMAQVWSLIPTGEIRNALAPDLCLETPTVASGGIPRVASCDNASLQRFGNGAQGELRLGNAFDLCVTAVDTSLVATTNTAVIARSAPSTLVTATMATVLTTAVAFSAPVGGIFTAPRVEVLSCTGGNGRSWQWGTF